MFSLLWLSTDTPRLTVRYGAAFTQKFSSSIAPHITTLLVHGKQVTCTECGSSNCLKCVDLFAFLRVTRLLVVYRVDESFSKSRKCLFTNLTSHWLIFLYFIYVEIKEGTSLGQLPEIQEKQFLPTYFSPPKSSIWIFTFEWKKKSYTLHVLCFKKKKNLFSLQSETFRNVKR